MEEVSKNIKNEFRCFVQNKQKSRLRWLKVCKMTEKVR